MNTHSSNEVIVVTDTQIPFNSLNDAITYISGMDKSCYPVGLRFQDGYIKWFVTGDNLDEFVSQSSLFKKLREAAKTWKSISE